jgi:hypothetical protein
MYISRLRLLGVKPLRCDVPAQGSELPPAARRRLLLRGANGSGKTVVLETIAALWRFLGDWIDVGNNQPAPPEHPGNDLAATDLAALEIHDLVPGARPLWVAVGRADACDDLKRAYPKHTFAGLRRTGGEWYTALPDASFLATFRQRSLSGTEPCANIVYFPPEGRTVLAPRKGRAQLLSTIPFHWFAPFDPKVNIDSVLLTVLAHAPERFDECLRLVNQVLTNGNKRVVGFSPMGRLVVEGVTTPGKTYKHPVELLSSGEKQMLLTIGFVFAFLRPGGILLIDEPDLHIHNSMVVPLMEALESIVRERQGQLIVVSHSTLVWDWFSDDDERIELGAPAVRALSHPVSA